MKQHNIITKLVTMIAVVAFSLLPIHQALAAEATASPTTASWNSVIGTNAVNIQQVTIANSAASALSVSLYDSPNTNKTYVRSAYTNTLSYVTNMVTVITNFSGVLQTNTNSVLYTYNSVAAQATNNYRLLVTLTVPASETITWTPAGGQGIYANFGVNALVDTNCTITVQYNSAR